MAFSVKILADSLAPCGERLTTWELTYPRFIHSEVMTHRVFSRNAASSRAIPIQKMVAAVIRDPAGPIWWGKNQAGMQAREELRGPRRWFAIRVWFAARWFAIVVAWLLWKIGLHKQIANRILEPWSWITVILSSTDFANFFVQRNHIDAQPEFAWVAAEMWTQYDSGTPRRLKAGEWHLPFVSDEEAAELRSLGIDPRAVSVGRCARVSYLTHDGRRAPHEDVGLHDRLKAATPGHWSPFEHVARAMAEPRRSGNFVGFEQYRKMFPGECVR
jgi:hypothetical protein